MSQFSLDRDHQSFLYPTLLLAFALYIGLQNTLGSDEHSGPYH